jgi:GT2 family glycosyltransferase
VTAVRCALAIADTPRPATSQLGEVEAPVAVADIEITEPHPGFPPPLKGEGPGQVLALVRIHTHPVGSIVLHIAPDGLTGSAVAGVIDAHFGPKIRAHLHADGRPSRVGQPPRCLRRRAEILSDPPLISVIVATRERPTTLARCLDSLLLVEYPRVEIVVVDNDPATGETAELVAKEYAPHGVGYVCERRRGLAAAHNRGVQMASGELLAFTDDDVVVDRHWVTALAEAFIVTDGVGAVTGLIEPGELRTATQLLLERHGAFAKGYEPNIFDLDTHRPEDPRFPVAAGQFGSGANMAFNRKCLQHLGGFNPVLGTGTLARGGDDLAAFFAAVTAGYRIVYQPDALVRHWHRDSVDALAQQAYGYGVGLGAYLTDALVHEPAIVLKTALSSTRPAAGGHRTRPAGWPPELIRLGHRGTIVGPFAYAASWWRARGARRPE